MEESFVCDKCDKTFAEKRYLTRHIQNKTCEKVFKCNKCGETFANRRNRDSHVRRKNPCVPTEVPVLDPINSENKCKFCGNAYATPYTLRRHITTCPMKNNQEALFQLVLTKLDKLDKLDEIVEENKLLKQQVPMQINNNLTVNQNLYVNVTICSFGSEDLSKLDQQGVIDLLKGQVKDFIPNMIAYIHANPKYPEFHNVFFDPIRKKVLVFRKNEENQLTWQFDDIEQVSRTLNDKVKDHIHPLNGPYFNKLTQAKDIDTANKIPQILCNNWDTPAVLEGTKESLSKVTENKGFLDQVSIVE